MANSMDTILVKYGTEGIDVEYDRSEHPEVKTVTLPEFLALPPEQLSENERKIQKATREVYDINGKEPPIYKGFPTLDPKKPLIINCTGKIYRYALAEYNFMENEIYFIQKEGNLTSSLAHELKHAEQHAQLEIQQIFNGDDNYKKRQLTLLNEAEASLAEILVHPEFKDKYSNPLMKMKFLKQYIRLMYRDPNLKKAYILDSEVRYPFLTTDTGLTKIPEHYGLPDDFLKFLNSIHKNAISSTGKFMQYWINRQSDQFANISREKRALILSNIFADRFTDKNDPSTVRWLRSLLEFTDTDGQPYFDKKAKIKAISNAIRSRDAKFEKVIEIFQDKNGNLPITAEDLTKNLDYDGYYYGNELLDIPYSTDSHIKFFWERFPTLLKLKGADGKPLVTPKEVIKKLSVWCKKLKPECIPLLFSIIADKDMQLPFSRHDFDIEHSEGGYNGENILLCSLADRIATEETTAEKVLAQIHVITALKDKEGKPIISPENVKISPRDDDFSIIIKECAQSSMKQQSNIKQQLKKRMQTRPKKIKRTSRKSSNHSRSKKEIPSL